MVPASTLTNSAKGIIGRSFEQGMPVVWSFVDELPDPATRKENPWLTVVSWPYDGSKNDGMPDEELRVTMFALERALDPLEESPFSLSAYRRTGNGLKEFSYYVGDRALFLRTLNELLAEHPRYPLEIKFYEDQEWSDFANLIADFRKPNLPLQPTPNGAAELNR